MDEIYKKCYDLSTLDKRYSPDDAAAEFTTTFLGTSPREKNESVHKADTHTQYQATPVTVNEPATDDSIEEIENLDDLEDYLNDL
jgi:hypothetical protein